MFKSYFVLASFIQTHTHTYVFKYDIEFIHQELNPTINSAAGSIADNSEIQLQFSEPFSRKDFSPTISPQKMHDVSIIISIYFVHTL